MLVSTYATSHQALAITPNAGLLHRTAKIATLTNDVIKRGKRAQFPSQRPHHDDGFDAFCAQPAKYFHSPARVASERCIRQFVDVVATAICYSGANIRNANWSLAQQ